MPPMATTGMETASHISLSVANDTASASNFVEVVKTEPTQDSLPHFSPPQLPLQPYVQIHR